MATDVVQFRMAHQDTEYLRSLGYKPNDLARDALTRELKKLRTEAFLEAIKRIRVKPGFTAADVIRAERDSH